MCLLLSDRGRAAASVLRWKIRVDFSVKNSRHERGWLRPSQAARPYNEIFFSHEQSISHPTVYYANKPCLLSHSHAAAAAAGEEDQFMSQNAVGVALGSLSSLSHVELINFMKYERVCVCCITHFLCITYAWKTPAFPLALLGKHTSHPEEASAQAAFAWPIKILQKFNCFCSERSLGSGAGENFMWAFDQK